MKQYRFTSGDIDETIEELGYKKAVKKFQSSHKNLKVVTVEWTTKRGKEMCDLQPLPIKTGGRW